MQRMFNANAAAMPSSTAAYACTAAASILIISAPGSLLGVLVIVAVLSLALSLLVRSKPLIERS